jgi:hypothetical protein
LVKAIERVAAKYEDPEVIRSWFELVHNTITKYGIHDADIYNFDKTGFMMGVISTAMVVTSSDGYTKAKRMQPGNREWATVIQGQSLCASFSQFDRSSLEKAAKCNKTSRFGRRIL